VRARAIVASGRGLIQADSAALFTSGSGAFLFVLLARLADLRLNPGFLAFASAFDFALPFGCHQDLF
jgi:hypothetical protein